MEPFPMTPMHRSKALAEAGYDATTRRLRVRFRHGGLYEYDDVAPEIFDGLLRSAHPWTEWGPKVKAHRYDQLE